MNTLILKFALLSIFLSLYSCSPQAENDFLQEENDEIQERIEGGYPAKQGQFPFAAAIYTGSEPECTGFIADKKTILTAAHCIGKNNATYTAKVGNVLREDGKEIKIRLAIPHPEHNESTNAHDVAVLIAEDEIHFDNNTQAICLEKSNTSHQGSDVLTMGFGITNCLNRTADMSEKLMYHLQTVASEYEGTIHTKGNSSKTCEGDSGGPLVLSKPESKLIAIGILRGGTEEAHAHEYYTRISKNLKFIRQHAKHATFC